MEWPAFFCRIAGLSAEIRLFGAKACIFAIEEQDTPIFAFLTAFLEVSALFFDVSAVFFGDFG